MSSFFPHTKNKRNKSAQVHNIQFIVIVFLSFNFVFFIFNNLSGILINNNYIAKNQKFIIIK